MKNKIPLYIFILILIGLFSPIFGVQAQATGTCTLPDGKTIQADLIYCQSFEPPGSWSSSATGYHLLEPLPCDNGTPGCKDGKLVDFNPEDKSAFGTYLNFGIRLFIGLCAVLAVVMIVIGGIEYMTSELISSKEAGKERIRGAILGLLLALGAYTILFQINPDLLNSDVDISGVELNVVVTDLGAENFTVPFKPIASNRLQTLGIQCNGGGSPALASTAQSFIGRSSYSMTGRNTISGNKAVVDCSAYVAQVYKCARLESPGGTTSEIFSSGNVVSVTTISADGTSINGAPLKVGDLVGWKKGGRESNGHVMMYIGNGQVIDAQNNRSGGVKVRALNSSQFRGRVKFVKRI